MRPRTSGHLLLAALILILAACSPTAGPDADSPPATPTSAAAAQPAVITAPPATGGSLLGPLVGFFIEDHYEDVYFSIFDAATGELRVLNSPGPIYLGEAQWVGNGCQLFIHGRLTDLRGDAQWSAPQEVAGLLEHFDASLLSPGRNYIVRVVSSGTQAGAAAMTDEVEIISLSPPYEVARLALRARSGDYRALA